MRILVVDDEPLARAHLKRLLEEAGASVAGEADNGLAALQKAEDLRPDLVFLDVQMPGMTGLQAAALLTNFDPAPLVVFVTGYSEYAVEAFEKNALDYLLKPASEERVKEALARAGERLKMRENRQTTQEKLQKVEAEAASPPLQRLPVREDYAIRLIRVEEILCVVAREKRVLVRTADSESRTYYTLTQLETLLPPERFCRTHDSCIVNLDQVERLNFLGNHSYSVELRNGWKLPVGRSRYPALQRKLGLETLPS